MNVSVTTTVTSVPASASCSEPTFCDVSSQTDENAYDVLVYTNVGLEIKVSSLEDKIKEMEQTIQSQPQIQVSNLPVSQTMQQQNVSGTVGASQPQPAGAAPIADDPSKRKMIQQQLLILFHASKCWKQERERQQENESNANVIPCTFPYCQPMKNVINHMVTCTGGKACTMPRCSFSRRLMSHWKNCTRLDCVVCMPLKRPSDKQQQNAANVQPTQPNQGLVATAEMKRAYGGLGLQYNDGSSDSNLQQGQTVGFSHVNEQGPQCSSQNFNHIQVQQTQGQLRPILQNSSLVSMAGQSALNFLLTDNVQQEVKTGGNMPLSASSIIGSLPDNPPIAKDWHQQVTKDLRQHLVQRIVYKIYPTTNLSTFQDARFINLVTYARKFEGDMYCAANSREEYYQLLAEKVYEIQKELDEKYQQRKEIQLKQVQQVGNNSGSMIGSNSGEQSPK